ncbi:MAG: DUF4835 domain-containing protein [Chitinophagales bacterium]|nr:MAG: DUF4835 domain-containing protein [Chitinophagales bacterium]
MAKKTRASRLLCNRNLSDSSLLSAFRSMWAISLILFFFFLPVFFSPASAQELRCKVEVISKKLQTTEAKVFKTLETSVFEFMNNRKWTNDFFKEEEKIECSLFINVTEELGANRYRAQVNILSSRPVFNSDYNSVILNHSDKDWVFEYSEFQPLDYNENEFTSNLTSMLAFYAYLIIGLDYDAFSLNGGTPYFQKAQTIVNNIPSGLSSDVAPGWKAIDSDKNRYWIVENLLNPRYAPIRQALYEYHLQGLDVMYEDAAKARLVILNAVRKVGEVAEEYPTALLVRMFFNAKSEELIQIFSGAPPNEKVTILQVLYKADPVNSSKYARIMKQ